MTLGVPAYLEEIILPKQAAALPAPNRRDAFGSIGSRAPSLTGGSVTPETAASVPAITQAIRTAAQGVARLELAAWTGKMEERRKLPRAWQSELFARPNDRQTRFELLEATEESLTARGNAFILKLADPRSGRPVELWALHPDQVAPAQTGDGWVVYAGFGFVDPFGRGDEVYEVPAARMLHLRGPGGAAVRLAPSPIARHADTIAAALARSSHERRMYEQGASVPWLFSFPADMTAEQAREFRDLWQESYAGVQNAGRVPVIGGGPEVVKIGLSQRDAQFVESAQLSVEDVARIFNVTPSLLGVQRSDRPLSPEHEEDRWLRYGLGPRLSRIEASVMADPDLFGRGSRVYPFFDTDDVIRGDIQTESEALTREVQAGIRLVDEARALRGLPPLPDGMGKIPQVVPVGGQANPVPAQSAPPPTDPAQDAGDPEVPA